MKEETIEQKLISRERNLLRLLYFLYAVSGIFSIILFFYGMFIINWENKVIKIGYENDAFSADYAVSELNRSDKMIEYFLSDYITNIRSLPDEEETLLTSWRNALAVTLDQQLLRQYYSDWQVEQRFEEEFIVFVQIEKIIKGIGNSYECHWKESIWRDRRIASIEYWYGYFDIKIDDTTVSEKKFISNPTGMWIENFSIANKEL